MIEVFLKASAAVLSTLLLTGGTHSPVAFPTHTVIDYQLGGAYPLAPGVGGVSRDSTDVPVKGRYSIRYINGFQSQPQDRNVWLKNRKGLLLVDAIGRPVADPNWPDEFILDTSTADKRKRIAAIIGLTVRVCAKKGFNAIEIDNLDTYSRSGGRLTQKGAIALARLYAQRAHALGLAIAQKNSSDLGTRGRDQVGFDFAVAEECQRFDECALYTSVYGDKVIDIEYSDDLRGTMAQVCADPQIPFSTIIRDRYLTKSGDPSYVFRSCH